MNETPTKIGRPAQMEDPRPVTIMLDRIHRDLIDVHMRRKKLASVAEAVRDIIASHFNVSDAE